MMETAAPGLHDAILLCAGIAAVYLVVAVMQLLQLRRRPVDVAIREPSVGVQSEAELLLPGSDKPFAAWLKRSNIDAELQHLHLEINQMRKGLSAAQDEIRQLRNVRNHSGAVPLYNEAMSLAKHGLNAVSIASRCGISLGEAELVASLARVPAESSEYDERHDDRYRAAA